METPGEKQSTELHERRVWYWLGGSFDPATITWRTKLEPTKTARPGDAVTPDSTRVHEESGWWVEPSLPRSVEVETQLDALLAILQPHWPELVRLGREFQAGVTVVIYSYDAQGPAVSIRPDVAGALHELNATLDFDLYNLVPGEKE